jgi:hypothetical protein
MWGREGQNLNKNKIKLLQPNTETVLLLEIHTEQNISFSRTREQP